MLYPFVAIYGVQVIVGLILAFVASWEMALVFLGLFPLLAIGSAAGMMVHQRVGGNADPFLDSGSVSQEILTNIRTVLAFPDLQTVKTKRFQDEVAKGLPIAQKRSVVMGITMGINNMLMFGFVYGLAIFFALKYFLATGRVDMIEVMSAFFGAMTAGTAVGQVTNLNLSKILNGYPIISVLHLFSVDSYSL